MAALQSKTIFVGNIPYDADESDIKEIFSRAGPVECLRLVYDKETRQPKGYGFCDFVDAESAMKAMKTLSDVECCGRQLRIDLADNALRSRKGEGKGGQLALGDAPGGRGMPAPQVRAPAGQAPNTLPAGSLDPIMEAKLKAAKNEPTPEAVAAEVSAHSETSQIVSSMSKVQLHLCLGAMQKLSEEAPESSRALLTEHPQLCYALLHAQMLFDLDSDPLNPPSADEMQHLRVQASMRPTGMPGALPGLHGMVPRPMMPFGLGMMPGMMGLPGGMPGMGGMPSMTFGAIPRPPAAAMLGGPYAKAPSGGLLPPALRPGMVSAMGAG